MSLDFVTLVNNVPHSRSEDQKAFVVVQYFVVMGKALFIAYTVESLHNGNAGLQYSLRHL